jgi:peptidase M28-like protein/PA domain-containing protein
MFESISATRLRYSGLSIACAVIAMCVLQPLLLAQAGQELIASVPQQSSSTITRHATPSTQACRTRVNDSSEKLLECIQQTSLWNHLSHFQKISDQNPGQDGHGNRDTGTKGYKASVDYVAGLMRTAGYHVSIQTYQFAASEVTGVPRFGTADTSYTPTRDFIVARLSGGGALTASIQPSAGSGNGCLPGDFAGFVPGKIVLLDRGTCAYDTQVANAEHAGAAAVILYNARDAQAMQDEDITAVGSGPGDGSAFHLRLSRPATIPVVAVSYGVGSELSRRYAAGNPPVVHLDIRMRRRSTVDYNLIAESRFGDPNHTVVVEGHLDSIFGAGMLDNASGSTTILEIALNMAKTSTRNRLRYIWFGGEEIGLFGSTFYTQNLTSTQRKRIAFDIDADVTATPNFDMQIADPAFAYNVSQFPSNVVPQSKIGNKYFEDYFTSIGVFSNSAPFGNSGTDSNSFALIGIPDSGILTRQDCCKVQAEVDIWGGFLGNYEGNIPGSDGGCVDHPNLWCDNLSNNDPFVFELVSKATANVVFKMANHPFKTNRP